MPCLGSISIPVSGCFWMCCNHSPACAAISWSQTLYQHSWVSFGLTEGKFCKKILNSRRFLQSQDEKEKIKSFTISASGIDKNVSDLLCLLSYGFLASCTVLQSRHVGVQWEKVRAVKQRLLGHLAHGEAQGLCHKHISWVTLLLWLASESLMLVLLWAHSATRRCHVWALRPVWCGDHSVPNEEKKNPKDALHCLQMTYFSFCVFPLAYKTVLYSADTNNTIVRQQQLT